MLTVYVLFLHTDYGVDATVYYKYFEDVVLDLLLDASLKDFMHYEAEPLYCGSERVFGPFSSGLLWQKYEMDFPDKTVINVFLYSDETEFYKGTSAHPIFRKFPSPVSALMLHCTQPDCAQCFYSYTGQYWRTEAFFSNLMETCCVFACKSFE